LKIADLKDEGATLFAEQNYPKAAKLLQAALDLDKSDPEVWALYFLSINNLGDRIAATNVFRALGDAIGDDLDKWLEIARLCEAKGNYEGAQHAYTQVIKRDPMNFALLDKIKELGGKKMQDGGSLELPV